MQNRNHKKTRPGLVAGSIIAVSVSFLAVAALLTVNNGVLATVTSFISDSFTTSATESQTSTTRYEPTENSTAPTQTELPYEDIFFTRPDQMKGAWIKAGTDYYIASNEGGQAVKTQIDAALTKLFEWGFNTVIIPISTNGKTFYISETGTGSVSIENTDGTDFDPPEYIVQKARERGMFTYGVIDLRVNTDDLTDPSTPDGAAAIFKMTREAVERYSFDGWMLDNPGYAKGSGGSYAEYMQIMPGGGFDRFQRDSVTVAVKVAVQTIKAKNKNLYVGLLADAVWANAADDELGSDTKGVYAQYTDGFADTRAWVKDGLFDFVMVKNGYSTSNSSVPFGKVIDWWTEICEDAKKPLYTAHDSSKVCGAEQGWKSPDQLAQQVLACKKSTKWQGGVFTFLTNLIKDTTGSTLAMLNAFKGSLNEEYISRKLVFNTPAKTTLTTYESKISIRGSADPNFPLTMNNKPVTLSAHGFFSLDFDLSVGNNTLTFKHKGDTVTYNITYRVVVLKSIQPASNISLDGGTTISISAEAYKGSNVYAKLGNTKIEMKQIIRQADEGESKKESDYAVYAGDYTLPAGIINKSRNLGTVTVNGSYKGINETKTGGTIAVKPIPIPEADDDKPLITGDNSPIDPGIGDKFLKSGEIITVTKDYAETFTDIVPTDDSSRPVNAYLPKGTTDVIIKPVVFWDEDGIKYEYWLLGCGRRVYQRDVTTFIKNGKITTNKMADASVSINTKATTITLNSTWHVPYNVRLYPQKYGNNGNEASQNYNISEFTATYVDIVFSYTTSIKDTPDISSSPLFSSAEWIKGSDDNTYTLRLHLRNKGAFYGYSVGWDKDKITFAFKNPTEIASGSKPLTGKRIVIDPGHGVDNNGTKSGTGGGTTSERAEVLKYGLQLRDKLTALGATVIMTRSTEKAPKGTLDLSVRTDFARNNYTDLFISIHMDSYSNSSARGYSIFYLNEFAYPYAKAINEKVKPVYKSFSGLDGRGFKWGYYAVTNLHDCPSILIECGFMSNSADLELLISSDYRSKFTQALADGILDYFKSVSAVAEKTAITGTTTTTTTTTTTAAVTTTLIAPAGMLALAKKRKKTR
ncbi:MAG: N-acetylmuramoyl-L-alanine amidase [Oscillospiraceae bacterium]|nr:N-acetylmuramoyl-L-alanine amidase [Oscillospiraceae bacterium]MDD4413033.1 N-acetylmuramoyl-L-alanine amidase [Oscillospiraceae bacterium]